MDHAAANSRPVQDPAATLIARCLDRAHLPAAIQHPEELVALAAEIFADNLSERGTQDFADWLGGSLRERIAARRDKVERDMDAAVQLLAQRGAVAPAVADDVLAVFLESLWEVLGRGQIDALIAQVPPSVARALMAAIPGEARGKF